MVRLRVHIVPIGFEVQRAVVPLGALRPDEVILVTGHAEDRARPYLEKVKAALKDARVPFSVVEAAIWDASKVVDHIGRLVSARPENEFFFNISTGTKPCSIAGTIAAMLWGLQIYYVRVDYSAKPVDLPLDFPVAGPPQFLPAFRVAPPEAAGIAVLELLARTGTPTPKREVLRHLRSLELVGPKVAEKVSPQAIQGQVTAILQKLESQALLTWEGIRPRRKIRITDSGREAAKMFAHALQANPTSPG
jgi:hypothetical protein